MISTRIKAAIAGIVILAAAVVIFFGPTDGAKKLRNQVTDFAGKTLQPDGGQPENAIPAGGSGSYTDSVYGFSFSYTPGHTVGRFEQGEGDVVLVQSPDKSAGFQVYVVPFDEAGPLTAGRIAKDLPDMPMQNVQEISFGPSKEESIQAVRFTSGQSREVWFIHEQVLYQISADISQDDAVVEMLKSWRWE